MSAARVFTLLLLDQGAQLWNPAGQEVPLPSWTAFPGEPGLGARILREALGPEARVQLILADSSLSVLCQEAPSLSPRECREVQQRLTALPRQHAAHTLEGEPQAEGGHVLWMASHPQGTLDLWLDALKEAGARPVFAMPWQRAFLGASGVDQPNAVFLTVLAGSGRLLFYQGRKLSYVRVFPLPEGPEGDPRSEPGARGLAELASEELSRLLQYLQQKHRGLVLTTLFTVGLPADPAPAMVAMGRALGLTLTSLEPDLGAFLRKAAERERRGKAGLDLLPRATREARIQQLLRLVARVAVVGVLILGGATRVLLVRQEKTLEQEVLRAQAGAAQRQALAQEGTAVERQRFGLLRLRRAEVRQGLATEQLEQLGLLIFQLPEGVRLQKVAITQLPGDALRHRFTVEGTALTRQGFSVGALQTYLTRLTALAGLELKPLEKVTVLDRSAPGGPEQALTQFSLEGTAP